DLGLRVEHEPQAAPHFLGELARLPQHHAGKEARLLRLAFDDAIHYVAVEGEVETRRQLYRAPARALALHHREDDFGSGRAAEINGVDHLLRRQVLGEELAE